MSAVRCKVNIPWQFCHVTVTGMLGHQLENNLKGSDSFFNVNGWRFGWNGIPLHYK